MAALVVVDLPVVARRRLEPHRHRQRVGRRTLAGHRVADEVEPARRLRPVGRDGDFRGGGRYRDRAGPIAGARLGIARIVDEARPHPDPVALVDVRERVGLRGGAGDVGLPALVHPDPLVAVDRRRHALGVADRPRRGRQRLAHPRRAGDFRTVWTLTAKGRIVADRPVLEAGEVVAGQVLEGLGVVARRRVAVAHRDGLAMADQGGDNNSESCG